MFSLENFYYILYTNLFKPARIRLNYFSPFGSKDPTTIVDLSGVFSNGRYEPTMMHKALFYDQEPLLKEYLDELINSRKFTTDFKHNQILVVSEISDLANEFCKKYNYSNLYYFFHGVAALDWYKDYQYLNIDYPIKKHFISLNHLVSDDRSYRLHLVSHFVDKGVIDKGIISLHHTDSDKWRDEIIKPNTKLSDRAKTFIQDQLSKVNLPLIADTKFPAGNLSAAVGINEIQMHQSAFLHVISETVFYYPKLHLTEKIFRPIVNRRPFILVGAPKNLAYLKRYGFKTFDRWIDESYDLEEDNDKRIEMISNEIEKICKLSINDLKVMQEEMQEILEFNFRHFYSEFKQIIIDEFLTNFKTCVTQWNSVRYDREINLDDINFERIRQLLLS